MCPVLEVGVLTSRSTTPLGYVSCRSARCSVTRLVLALLVLAALPAVAQDVSDADRARGYLGDDGSVTFVFDPALYGFSPSRVAVTGPFRGWSSDDADPDWALVQTGDVWTLVLEDAEAAGLGPATPFKFRGDGRWLDPTSRAENVAGGNLIYRFGEVAPRLVAELRGPNAIWVSFEGVDRPLDESFYRVIRWDGIARSVYALTPHEDRSALLDLGAFELDPHQVHYVEASTDAGQLRTRARFDGLWRDMAAGGQYGMPTGVWIHNRPPPPPPPGSEEAPRDLGSFSGETHFRMFAPRADSVRLYLYADRTGAAQDSVLLHSGGSGRWAVVDYGTDLRGMWYDYAVYGPDGPGSAFTNQTGERVSDPYALVSDDSWGRGRIWQDTFRQPRPVEGGRPAMEDVVAYEVHLQDFTDELPGLEDGAGPLEAFVVPGLTNERGEPIGLDYLERLGINTVHLLPVQEYLHYPDDAWRAAFEDDAFMIEQGIATENYQWGYRTTHAFAVESRFRSAGDEPGRERERFRDLVDALHARGMAVVVDVVFNHTGENMEGVEQLLTFNGIDKWYYYRLDDEGNHIGAFGNEVKSENRPMTQRWLLDQLRHFVDVFGVDGFRIDLAGQTDEQTLRWLQASLGEDVLIYGEPWIGSNDPDYEANPSWDWYKADSPITFFQDDARNAFKGSPGEDPTPDPASRGFAGGDPAMRDAALAGVANAYPEESTPNAGINYLDIHDNWALADRFSSCQAGDCAWDGREGVLEAEMRIAAALLMTSLGPVVMHGGTEIARSKGLAPLPEEINGEWERTEMGIAPIYIKGRGDTYNLRAANRFDWTTVGLEDGAVDYAEMEDWWRGLIALRLSEAGEVFRIGGAVPEGWVQTFEHPDPNVLMYLVGERVFVRINTGGETVSFGPIDLPGEGWATVAVSGETDVHISPTDLSARRIRTPVRQMTGTMGPKSVWIMVRD